MGVVGVVVRSLFLAINSVALIRRFPAPTAAFVGRDEK
jgi:hypothetical protein